MSEEVKDSCGCVFCDLGLRSSGSPLRAFHRIATGAVMDCTKPVTSDNLRPIAPAITDKEAGQ